MQRERDRRRPQAGAGAGGGQRHHRGLRDALAAPDLGPAVGGDHLAGDPGVHAQIGRRGHDPHPVGREAGETAIRYGNGKEKTLETIGILGLGYVGLPLAVEFAEAGKRVIGVDVVPPRGDIGDVELEEGPLPGSREVCVVDPFSNHIRFFEPPVATTVLLIEPVAPAADPSTLNTPPSSRTVSPPGAGTSGSSDAPGPGTATPTP